MLLLIPAASVVEHSPCAAGTASLVALAVLDRIVLFAAGSSACAVLAILACVQPCCVYMALWLLVPVRQEGGAGHDKQGSTAAAVGKLPKVLLWGSGALRVFVLISLHALE